MNVLYCTNGKYAKYAAISMLSVIDNGGDKEYHFYVFHDRTCTNLDMFKKVEDKFRNVSITLIDVEDAGNKLFSKLYLKTKDHISAYYRLLVYKYLANLDRLLYLDSDTLVVDSIAEMYCYNFGDNKLMAVKEYVLTKQDHPLIARRYKKMSEYFKSKFKIQNLNGYFNSGVLVFNLKGIKDKEREFIRLMNFAKKNDNFFHDQNVLNVAYKDKVYYLDWNFNVLNELRSDSCSRFEWDVIDRYRNLTQSPKVIHFTPVRPWDDKSIENWESWHKYELMLEKILNE